MAAVEVRNGYKCYGRAKDPNKKIVLNYLNMNVKPGSIYGLLGASGCGKTTLLACIVGQRQLNSGEVRVLGIKPGLPGSGVPGPRVGYMPQEIALVEEMSVKETIFYFGQIYGLNDDEVNDRYKLLRDLLELPPSGHLIRKCSGGQKRRVSFACALVHEPELLILDEPTVGLDPLLREKIWTFLIEKTKNSKMAVIITTHYIEEARQADCIGLMRNGILLAEDTPDNIMRRFESNSIEDAFLLLSQRQGTSEEADRKTFIREQLSKITTTDTIKEKNNEDIVEDDDKKLMKKSFCSQARTVELRKKIFFTTKSRMKALLRKNMVQLTRQPSKNQRFNQNFSLNFFSGIVFMFLFPILQLSCFYLAIGNDPKNLKLGVVNYEIDDPQYCHNESLVTTFNTEDTCHLHKISCRYINGFDSKLASKVFYKTGEEAFAAAKRTDVIGYIEFAKNFSESMQRFIEDGRFTDEESSLNSELAVRLDMSNQQVALFMERRLREVYTDFIQNLMVDCKLPKNLGSIPVQFRDPIFGSFHQEFREFLAPGVVMTIIFFLATLITAAVFITERSDGIWDRTLVAGISTFEMLVAHIFLQSGIMFVQCLEVIFYIAVVFDVTNHGDNLSVIIILTLTGFSGMLFGLLISIYCKTHTMANFVATGVFYPMIMLCGLLWPIEGMPTVLREVALLFPFTIPTVSVRNILSKGWSITNFQVYNGFLIMLLWILSLFICCVIGLRRKA